MIEKERTIINENINFLNIRIISFVTVVGMFSQQIYKKISTNSYNKRIFFSFGAKKGFVPKNY